MNYSIKERKTLITGICVIALIFGMGVSATAASSATGAINGYETSASSSISSTSASAKTSYEASGSVTVSSTYSYVNTNTLVTGTSTKNNGHYTSCSVNFSAPSNCRSVKISSSHSVSAYGQNWTTSTSGIY